MARDYAPRGVRFYYIYKALAHPEHDGYVQPFTLEERLMHVREAERTLGSQIPWLCDAMENRVKHALGDAPNSEFVMDPEGKVVRRRRWSDPEQLRKDLEELVGPVENPTRVADLDLRTEPPPTAAAVGVVELIPRSQMRVLQVEPQIVEGGQPFYAKLRAEAGEDLLRSGRGTLYLGLHLDPLYHVHWNNLAKPVKVEIAAPEGTEVSPTTLEGLRPDVSADVDPREFLVEIQAGDQDGPLRLTVSYFACNDAEGWCKAVRQHYVVRLAVDPDGGRATAVGGVTVEGGRGRVRMLSGRAAEVKQEGRTLRMRTPGGEQREVTVADDALIVRDGIHSRFEEIEPGDVVRLRFERGAPVAVRMMVRSAPPR